MKFKLIILAVVLLTSYLFYNYGRNLWFPYYLKIKGKETVDSRINSLKSDVYNRLLPNFKNIGLDDFPKELIFISFKKEQLFEVYTKIQNKWKLLKRYKFTNFSGKLGPKLKEGDKQIPEGIYKIEYINPNSTYYLSLKVNYPNEFDKEKAKYDGRKKLGGDIFIHGKDLTIGCIPLGDDAIEEIFILATQVKNKEIKVIISPKDFRNDKNNPKIDLITWENELYDLIRHELNKYFH